MISQLIAKKLSIVVPAYKVEDFIEKCIRSLEDQDIPKEEYEIIVTNDGSPDRCKEIVEGLQNEFNNIILINQENQGVSMARNNAIAIAKGKYIISVDPDDFVVENTFGHIIQELDETNPDVLFMRFDITDQKGTNIWYSDFKSFENKSYTGEQAYFLTRGLGQKDVDRSIAMAFRKELLQRHDLKYPSDVPYLEDGVFIGKVFLYADKVVFTNFPFYIRTTRKGSATNSDLLDSDKAAQGFIIATKDLLNLKPILEASNASVARKNLLNHLITRFALLTLMPSASKRELKIFSKRVKQLKAEGIKKLPVDGARLHKGFFATAYNISPYLYLLAKQIQMVDKKVKLKLGKKK
jgi:glycosyltransferase involved in cell wall biosynthesis